MTRVAPEPPALRTARLRLIGSGILIALALALALGLPREIPLQDAFFDALQRRSPRIAEATPVVIVEIDEKSIAALGPWGVDVASGVEAHPGIKDPEQIRTFVRAARDAFAARARSG